MKRSLFISISYILLALIVCGCAKNTDNLLNFPDLEWGMTPESVMQVLDEKGLDYTVESASPGEIWAIALDDVTLFGSEVESAHFIFLPEHLNEIVLYYPDTADMAVVNKELSEYYGEPVKCHTSYALDENLKIKEYICNEHNVFWESDTTIWEYLGDQAEEYLEEFAKKNTHCPKDVLREYLQRSSFSYIYWTDNYGDPDAGFPLDFKNFVYLNAWPILP